MSGEPSRQDGPGRTRARNPWGQGDRLREEILQAAGRLLGELGGAEGLTLRGVARAAGIAPASIYAHFAAKNDLVAEVRVYQYELLLNRMREAEAQVAETDLPGRLRAQLHAYCRYAMDNPGNYRIMFGGEEGATPSPVWTVIESLTGALARCAEAGRGLRLSAERAAIVLMVGTHGRVAIWHARRVGDEPAHNEASVRAFADELLSLVFVEAPSHVG